MSEFTILYRGVPLGIAVGEPRTEIPHPKVPGLPPRPVQVFCREFRPLPGYASIAPIIQLATQAISNFGFLGSAADPASRAAGAAAQERAGAICEELEILTADGHPLSGQVLSFLDDYRPFGMKAEQDGGLLHIVLYESGARITARLEQPRNSDGEQEELSR